MKFLIDNFGVCNLFGRQNYEYYARLTSRVLRIQNNLIFTYKYPHELFLSTAEESTSGKSSPGGESVLPNVDEVQVALRGVNRYSERTQSLSFLPQVHERQAQRMKIRSEWFLNPTADESSPGYIHAHHPVIHQSHRIAHHRMPSPMLESDQEF